ncbi:hypothetical protein CsSME_00017835 [Camellia sinensis var. sinensis]
MAIFSGTHEILGPNLSITEMKTDSENSFLVFFKKQILKTKPSRGKANFFERRVGDYQKASVMSNLQDGGKNFIFKLDEDF